jgi:hypothetical protein
LRTRCEDRDDQSGLEIVMLETPPALCPSRGASRAGADRRACARDRRIRAGAGREAEASRRVEADRETGTDRRAAARASAAKARADCEAGAALAQRKTGAAPGAGRPPRVSSGAAAPRSRAARRRAAAATAGASRAALAAEAGDRDRRRFGAPRRGTTPRRAGAAASRSAAQVCDRARPELRSRRLQLWVCRTNPQRSSQPCALRPPRLRSRASARSVARPPASSRCRPLGGRPVRDPGAEPTPSRVAARDPAPANAASRSRSNDPKLRGVSLGSLASCVSDREEDALKQQLVALVGEPAECVSAAGRYRFVETRNLNAFLLWVERAPARPEADRCVELTHALDCVRKRGGREWRRG